MAHPIEAIAKLVEADVLFDDSDFGDGTGNKVFVNLNDTFAYACSDAEEIPNDQLEEIVRIYKRWGDVGLICWTARQRNEDPVVEYTEDPVYQETWKALYGDLKVQLNFCNQRDPRWSDRKLNLKKWEPRE